MSTKEKYSIRRRSDRRNDRRPDSALETSMPNQRIRQGDRRCNPRRHNERHNLLFEILLPDQSGKTINVSASGVYFEVATNDMEAFPPGATVPLQISTVTTTPGSLEKEFKLSGKGTVIRNCIIENPGHDKSLGIALKFTDKLSIVDSD